MFSGQPMSTPFELTGGASSISAVKKPRLDDAGIATPMEVPGTQLHGELRFRTSANTFGGFAFEQGTSGSTQRLSSEAPPVGDRDVFGVGGVFGGSTMLSPEVRLGYLAAVTLWDVPYVTYARAADGTVSVIERDSDKISTYGVGLTPSYRTGPLVLFGTVFLRNHPVSNRSELLETDPVEGGPFNVAVAAGVEYEFAPRLSATALVQQNLSTEPVHYGPGLQLALTGKLGN